MGVQNIEMNIKNDLGTYDVLYPQTICQNIIDLIDNYYSKNQIVQGSTLEQYGLSTSSLPDDLFSTIKTLIQTAQNTADNNPKLKVGQYVGTGTYGSSNPNQLSLGITPRVVWVHQHNSQFYPDQGGWNSGFMWMYGVNVTYIIGTAQPKVELSYNSGKLSWYNTYSEWTQLNASGIVYDYIALID